MTPDVAGPRDTTAHAAMLAVTIESIPGFTIVAVLGTVLGVAARPPNAFLDGARQLPGAAPPDRAEALSGLRREAAARMSRAAAQRGANAVVGMRFDHRPVGASWTEVCAYGTAVLVVRRPPT